MKLEIVTYVTTQSIITAVEHLRVIGPLTWENVEILPGITKGHVNKENLQKGQIIVFQRNFPEQLETYEEIFNIAQRFSIPVVFDIDDLLIDLPENHPDRQSSYYSNALLPMVEVMVEADSLTVSTHKLHETLSHFNDHVSVLPNLLDDRLWIFRPPKDSSSTEIVNIGYMGGGSHRPDIDLVVPALLEISKKYHNRINFSFYGMEPPANLEEHVKVKWLPIKSLDYRAFASDFNKFDADIVIAPLGNNLFNQCKSGIKYLEYSTLGLPGVYSNLEPYNNLVTHEENGYLASSKEDWINYLSLLIEDPILRYRMSKQAQEYVRENWLMSKKASLWCDKYEEIIARVSRRSASRNFLVNNLYDNSSQVDNLQETSLRKMKELQNILDESRRKNANLIEVNHKLVKDFNEQLQKNTSLESELFKTKSVLAEIQKELAIKQHELTEIYISKAWKLAMLLRDARVKFLPFNSKAYLIARRGYGLFKKVFNHQAKQKELKTQPYKPLSEQFWVIMATPHTLFVANLIANRLKIHGCQVEITTDSPVNFLGDYYVVICPQMFDRLPPDEKRISFQMEQTVSKRWFNTKYLKILKESLAVLDYSLINIEYLHNKGIRFPKVYYLPIGAFKNEKKELRSSPKEFDLIFYGDEKSSPRRRSMLQALKKEFNIFIVSEVFGSELLALLVKSRFVINLHYYENALLEMPRIQESLSLGVPVISENSIDKGDYPELDGAVTYFEEGSTVDMLHVIRRTLNEGISTEQINQSVEKSAQRFEFMFDRFLLGMGFLQTEDAKKMELAKIAPKMVVSLPETITRRRKFEKYNLKDYMIFDGVRSSKGWVGCALSYSMIASKALDNGFTRLIVAEDDVLLSTDFQNKMKIVNEYLNAHNDEWDVFVGVIADLHPDTEILKIENYRGLEFVTINKMTSMVFNIYNKKALQLLTEWDLENDNVQNNTIDRYLEAQSNLRVVLVFPFFIGHRDDAASTIWGFKNTQYNELIAKSQGKLRTKIRAYKDDSV